MFIKEKSKYLIYGIGVLILLLFNNLNLYSHFYKKSDKEEISEISLDEIFRNRFLQDDYISLSFGHNIRMVNLSSDFPDHIVNFITKNKKGTSIDLCYIKYFSNNKGVGLNYNVLRIRDQEVSEAITSNGDEINGFRSNDLILMYLAPTFAFRKMTNDYNSISFSFGIGIINYDSFSNFRGDAFARNFHRDVRLESKTVGLSMSIAYDHFILKHWSLGASFSIITGRIFNYSVYDYHTDKAEKIKLNFNHFENLSRIEISAGIRRHF